MSSKLTALGNRRTFAKLRNKGLVQKNKEMHKAGAHFQLVKSSSWGSPTSLKVVHCTVCGGAYNRKYFYHHKKVCGKITPEEQCQKPIPVELLDCEEESDDFLEMLKSFHNYKIVQI